jgi:hypothetical protein
MKGSRRKIMASIEVRFANRAVFAWFVKRKSRVRVAEVALHASDPEPLVSTPGDGAIRTGHPLSI